MLYEQHYVLISLNGKEINKYQISKLYRPESKRGEFSLEHVEGVVKMAEAITIQPGETTKISGIAPLKGNSKRINVFTEPLERTILEDSPMWAIIPSYLECKNSSSRVGVAVHNIS